MDPFEFFQFKKIWIFNKSLQIFAIATLYTTTVLLYFAQVKATGAMDGYPPSTTILFVPIYEEWLFRGIFLRFFETHYGKWIAIAASSLLFGLWHLKNIFWLPERELITQIVYTAFIFGPLNAWLTLKTRSLWPSVIIHYINNLPLKI